MNKTFVVIAAVVILALLGGGAYMMMNRSGAKPQDSSNSLSVSPTQSTSVKKTLRDLASFGENQECTFSDSETGNTGTVYIGKGDVRGDFESNVDGETVNTHMLQDAENMYIWTDGEAKGIKVALDSVEKAAESMGNAAIDLNKEADYNCKSWSADAGVFEVPSDVEFQDYSKMMEGVSELMKSNVSGTPGFSLDCSACDNLSGDAKVSCRTALKCN